MQWLINLYICAIDLLVFLFRCALTWPNDIYKSDESSHHLLTGNKHNLDSDEFEIIFKYFWKKVKTSKLCSCKSEFFCSTSHNINCCQADCCGKCQYIVESDSECVDFSDMSSTTVTTSEKDSSSDQNTDS